MTHGQRVQPLQSETFIIAALTVMSGMDPHMISGNLGWVVVKSWVELCRSGFY
jgi:hypothetical protein